MLLKRFEDMVERYPDKCAMKTSRQEITFLDLQQLSNNPSQEIISETITLPSQLNIDIIIDILAALKTGKPCIFQSPEALLHAVDCLSKVLSVSEKDNIALFSSSPAYFTLTSIFTALLNGASLCLFDSNESSAADISQWLCESEITIWLSLPAFFHSFMDSLTGSESVPLLRYLAVSGEISRQKDVLRFKKVFPNSSLVKLYGHPEIPFIASQVIETKTGYGTLILGPPADGTGLLVLDENNNAVPMFAVGEIVVTGNLFPPCFQEKEKTSQKVFGSASQLGLPEAGRFFRTGDPGLWDYDGSIQKQGEAEVIRVTKVTKVPKVPKVTKVTKVTKVRKVTKVPKVSVCCAG
ncbi:MAG: amino acid adenylation domain-containing protein, partial [bacterium]|nr:amino acid adenylation domain-containing protein [bacterium]